MNESCEDLKRRAIAAANDVALKRQADQETSKRRDFEKTYAAVVAKLPLLTKDDVAMTYELCGHRFRPYMTVANGGGIVDSLYPDRSWYALRFSFVNDTVYDEASFGRYLLAVAEDDARRAADREKHHPRRGFWASLFSHER